MITVFLLTWQLRRPGLYASPLGRAGLATLRDILSPSSLSRQHFRETHAIAKCLLFLPPLKHDVRPRIVLDEALTQLSKQARCVSLWKGKSEEPLRQEAGHNETFMLGAEINSIFGLKLGRKEGNDLLRRLQEQRHQGTLDQKLPYPDALIDKGLTYLRAKYPVDEDVAIIERIDREADEGIRLPQVDIGKSPHAVSQFEKLIRENREKREEEEQKVETKVQQGLAEETHKDERMVTVRDGTALVQLRPEPEWVREYRDKALMKEIPDMSALARLLPSSLVTIAVVLGAVLFAQNYKQPSRQARLWPDLPPAAATVTVLIGVNVAVFILWRLPPLWRFLNRNFLVVPAYPHSVSMLTACFSHQSFSHLLANVIPIWLIGTRCMSIKSLLSDMLRLIMLNSTRRHWPRAVSSSLLF